MRNNRKHGRSVSDVDERFFVLPKQYFDQPIQNYIDAGYCESINSISLGDRVERYGVLFTLEGLVWFRNLDDKEPDVHNEFIEFNDTKIRDFDLSEVSCIGPIKNQFQDLWSFRVFLNNRKCRRLHFKGFEKALAFHKILLLAFDENS